MSRRQIALILVLTVSALSAFATKRPHPVSIQGDALKPKADLRFDGSRVEAVNGRGYDSFNHVSEADGRRKKHYLYEKRTGFQPETAALLQQMRYN